MAVIHLLLPTFALAGGFSVMPVRVEFDSKTKSSMVNVTNTSKEKLNVELSMMLWRQDAEGNDQYTETSDVVYFPKVMTLEGESQRAVRLGLKTTAGDVEKTYRLFVREIPLKKPGEGATVTIAVRFGVPIFVKPQAETLSGEISAARLDKGELEVVVRNTGNAHFTINGIKAAGRKESGEESFAKELSGWYLLPGVSRAYKLTVPEDTCIATKSIDIQVAVDRAEIKGKTIDVREDMCKK